MFPHITVSRSLPTKGSLHFGIVLLLVLLAIQMTVFFALRAKDWWDNAEARLGRISDLYDAVMQPLFSLLFSFSDVGIVMSAFGILMSTLIIFVLALPSTSADSVLNCH